MKPIFVAFDSFKGSLTAPQACAAFATGVRDILPEVEIRNLAISDGGEGFSELVSAALGGTPVECRVSDPLGREHAAHYAIVGGDSAVVALAEASGLTLLDVAERNPLVASTYGMGEMLRDALSRGCRRIIVGLGGSATTDGGAGVLRALGCHFYDAEGVELTATIDILERVARIDASEAVAALRDVVIEVAVDVGNPLYGDSGAAYVFAPQKGADVAMVERLDAALRHYAEVVDGYCGYAASQISGAGAAGGVGYAFVAILGCRLTPGIELLLDMADFDAMVADAGLVVTGEGRVDSQTLMGKAPSGVLHRAQRHGVACVAVGGSVVMSEDLQCSGFSAIYESKPQGASLAEAMNPINAFQNLQNVGREVAEAYKKGMTNM